jgi:predicted transcriptional regulator
MTAKELLRERLEELSEDEAMSWLGFLEQTFSRQSLSLTPEQRASLERGMADARAGRLTPHSEVRRHYGLE